jgi:hypothetical protein
LGCAEGDVVHVCSDVIQFVQYAKGHAYLVDGLWTHNWIVVLVSVLILLLLLVVVVVECCCCCWWWCLVVVVVVVVVVQSRTSYYGISSWCGVHGVLHWRMLGVSIIEICQVPRVKCLSSSPTTEPNHRSQPTKKFIIEFNIGLTSAVQLAP